MNHKNLIPANRVSKNRSNRSIRRWVTFNAAYAAIVLITACVLRFGSDGEDTKASSIASLRSDTSKANLTIASLRKESAQLKLLIDSGQQISQTPDWSILLRVLAKSLGDQVVLNRVDCMGDRTRTQPVTWSIGSVPAAFNIAGVGRSQQAVTGFVLKLEQLHLFARVKLVRTSPVTLAGYQAIGFDLQCDLNSTEGKP